MQVCRACTLHSLVHSQASMSPAFFIGVLLKFTVDWFPEKVNLAVDAAATMVFADEVHQRMHFDCVWRMISTFHWCCRHHHRVGSVWRADMWTDMWADVERCVGRSQPLQNYLKTLQTTRFCSLQIAPGWFALIMGCKLCSKDFSEVKVYLLSSRCCWLPCHG